MDDKNPTQLYVGRIEDFKAKVIPDDATNPYYDVTSSDSSVIEVIKTIGTDGYHYALKGNKTGKATITVTAKGNQAISKSVEIQVADGIYFNELDNMIAEAENAIKYSYLYTESSLNALKVEVNKAIELKDKENVTQTEVNNEVIELYKVILALEYRGSNDGQEDATKLISNENMTVEATTSASESPVENIIDGNEKTFWHSNYNDDKLLPESVTVDLGYTYVLSQLNYLARQDGQRNGDITKYKVEVSLDGKDYTPVVVGTFDNDGNSLINRDEYKKIKFNKTEGRYVRFTALESLGDKNNAYASAAELQFFGVKAGEQVPAEDIVLDTTEVNGLRPGESKKVNATIKPFETTDTLTWISNNPEVATVDAYGNITAVASGTATITVYANENIKKEIKVTVEDPENDNLKALIKEAKEIEYTNDILQNALNEAIKKAEDAIGSDDETVRDAYYALAGTMSELDLINDDVVAVETYANIDLTKYEENEAKKDYKKLISNVSDLVKDPITNKVEISKLHNQLDNAYAKLSLLNLDQLDKAIELAEKVDLDAYVDDNAKKEFVEVLNEAKSLNPKTNAEIDEIINKLSSSLKALSVKATEVQKNTIKELIDKLNSMNKESYSKENQQKIDEAIKKAVKALKNDNLSQKEAESLINELSKVLNLKPEQGNESNKPGQGNGNNGGTSGGNDVHNPSTGGNTGEITVNPSEKPNSDTPKTGVKTQASSFAGLLAIGGIGAWFASRKKRKNQE